MVRESVKNLSQEEQRIYMDLDLTEYLFIHAKSKEAKTAINNLRYLLILELHRITNHNYL